MSSREAILKAIKEGKPRSENALPEVNILHTTYEDLDAKFATTLASVGGNAVHLEDKHAIEAYVKEHYKDAAVIVSTVEGLSINTKELNATDDPHTLKDVDLAIIKGEFAVAENGAVWVKEADARHRALYFIAQKLMIVVPKGELVHSMHEAYTRVNFDAKDVFGLFISGPSKTADIEQSLVIGAHGATEACVVFV
ncbi:LutC/YkgG family protein [Sulfurospirillum oryzae]|uniref:LutC/YkgG family protein n=1 Tax=Sulfurospirillum oryzae TaxID=2976535 RepID=UPI0021E802F5|nr:lactate utilization protein [Sulfurospirillum oryzae]